METFPIPWGVNLLTEDFVEYVKQCIKEKRKVNLQEYGDRFLPDGIAGIDYVL